MGANVTRVVDAPLNGYKLRERDPGRHPLPHSLNGELPISERRIKNEESA